jgi:hypothetical protein
MEKRHHLTEGAIKEIDSAIHRNESWLAINSWQYQIGTEDIYFFSNEDEALLFVENNVSDFDSFKVVHFNSADDTIQQLLYGKTTINILSSKNTSVMNQENLNFLQDRLFYLGTEKRLFPELEKNITEGKPEFKLAYSNHYDKDKLSASLLFRKSDNSDMYFLNRYEATLQKPAEASNSHTFYLDNGKGVTMKEAYNLLDGRAVNKDLKNKEGVVYNAWVKLDFNNKDENGNAKMLQYHKNYGYDLTKELSKLPIIPMSGENTKQLIASLERGNKQTIKLPEGVFTSPVQISANPQFKTLDIYDESGKQLSKEEKKELYIQAAATKSKTLDKGLPNLLMDKPDNQHQRPENTGLENKNEKMELGNQKQEQKTPTKSTKKERIESLLPKKSASHKKGLSL